MLPGDAADTTLNLRHERLVLGNNNAMSTAVLPIKMLLLRWNENKVHLRQQT